MQHLHYNCCCICDLEIHGSEIEEVKRHICDSCGETLKKLDIPPTPHEFMDHLRTLSYEDGTKLLEEIKYRPCESGNIFDHWIHDWRWHQKNGWHLEKRRQYKMPKFEKNG